MTLSELERKLEHKFTNTALLKQALTHRSFGTGHNERLEFLGDSVLNFCIADMIFNLFPAMPEGELSRLRANLVNQSVLAIISTELDVGTLLSLGDGEVKTGGANRPSILADALEAILGAVFLDAGFHSASSVVRVLFMSRIEAIREAKPVKDAKTGLQEWLQGKRLPLPAYTVRRIEGESHRQIFHVECAVAAFGIKTEGSGVSRRLAEQDAAAQAMAILTEKSTSEVVAPGRQHGR
jgi:ribonuclease III